MDVSTQVNTAVSTAQIELTPSYYLRINDDQSARIYLRITEGRGAQFRFSTGYSLNHVTHWNERTEQIRSVAAELGYDEVNVQLAKLLSFVKNANLDAKARGIIRTKAFYAQVVNDFRTTVERTHRSQFTIGSAFTDFIEHSRNHNSDITGARMRPSTLETYELTLRQIEHVSLSNQPLTEVDMEWYREFVSRSEAGGRSNRPLSKNYIGKHIKNIKRVLAFKSEHGEEVNPAYRSRGFKVLKEESTSVWLTLDELDTLRNLDLSEQKGLYRTRDLFLIGCFTGLRVSDLQRLDSSSRFSLNGIECFSLNQRKTGQRVAIPVHPVVKEILDRYGDAPPPSQHEQVMNRNLKRIGQQMELTQPERTIITLGGQETASEHPKWSLLTTHCARRSFCTNNYLSGTDVLTIMAISGHKTEKSFRRYLKLGPEDYAQRMAQTAFFNP